MEILETKERKMNKIQRKEREYLHTFQDTPLMTINYANFSFFILYLLEKNYMDNSATGVESLVKRSFCWSCNCQVIKKLQNCERRGA